MSNKKFALITGGSKRIGAAICRRLHKSGIDIMIHYRHSKDEAIAIQKELNEIRKDSIFLVKADLLDPDSYSFIISEMINIFGSMDYLVNNASSFYPTRIGEITLTQWEDLISTNLKAPVFLSQAAALHLLKSNGAIVNITDAHIENSKQNYVVYSIAKSGLSALTKSLANELGPHIRVNAVAPGAIVWPDDIHEFSNEYRNHIINQSVLKRIGDPDDIAKAVEFLLLNAPFVTGETINVDGGSW